MRWLKWADNLSKIPEQEERRENGMIILSKSAQLMETGKEMNRAVLGKNRLERPSCPWTTLASSLLMRRRKQAEEW